MNAGGLSRKGSLGICQLNSSYLSRESIGETKERINLHTLADMETVLSKRLELTTRGFAAKSRPRSRVTGR